MVSRRPWSRLTVLVSPVGLPSLSTCGASSGVISRSNRPSAQAWAASACERTPSPSTSARVMPRRLAMRSAASN
ncbi:Uncharacterised protein [Mycobacteroides abscessus subsp. abscessus]|nr:Uncharacterised protein [Mycobacteroides abscessus subsp. abscessus]